VLLTVLPSEHRVRTEKPPGGGPLVILIGAIAAQSARIAS